MKLFRLLQKSIQCKVIAITVIVLFVSLSILGACNYYNAKKMLVADAEENLSNRADACAQEIGMWFDSRKTEISILATNQSIVNGDTENALNYLAAETKRNPLYSRFWLVNLQGQAIHTTRDRTNIADRDYFKQVLSTGQAFVTDPVISKVDGKMVVSVVAPIKKDNQIVGVLGGTLMVDNLISRINEIKLAQSGYAYVIQGDGLTIIHPDKQMVMKTNLLTDQNTDTKLKDITGRMIKGEKGIGSYTVNGITKYVAFAPIPGSHWSLGANVPVNEILTKLMPLTITSFVLIVLILLLTCTVSIFASRRLTKPIIKLSTTIAQIAQGDLTDVPDDKAATNRTVRDELGQLSANVALMTANLRNLIRQVAVSSEQVAASSEELTASADQSAQAANQVAGAITAVASGAETQQKSIDSTTEIVENLSAGVQQIAGNADSVANTAEKTARAAKEGGKAVEGATVQMQTIEASVNHAAKVIAELGERSQEIGKIVDTISGIAGQTNLLALNAAIEAARAGEQGRGFAVVSEEIRKLAEQSQTAAKHIAVIIGQIQSDTEKAVQTMASGTQEVQKGTTVVNTAGEVFGDITAMIQEVFDQVRQISTAIQHTAKGIQQIVASVQEIDKISRESVDQTQTVSAATQEQSASMEEIAASSQALAKMSEQLQGIIAHFKV